MKARFFALMALVLGLASCQTDMVDGVKVDANGEAAVTIQVGLPQEAATRANSALGAIDNGIDMSQYDIRFILAVYDKEGTLAKGPMVKYGDEPKASFTFRLVPGRKYQFVAWADFVDNNSNVDLQYYETDLHYDTSKFPVVSLKEGDAQNLNDESRDAYTQVVTVDDFSGASSIPQMVLTRPFAKLRVITTDMDQLYSNLESVTVDYTSKIYTSFNALSSAVVKDSMSDLSAKTVTYPENYNGYVYGEPANGEMTLFADYIFGGEDDKVHFTLDVADATGFPIPQVVFNTNIPVQRNYLTTIKGNVLTDANNITVTIEDDFTQPGIDVDMTEIETAEELAAALTANEENIYVILGNDIDLPISSLGQQTGGSGEYKLGGEDTKNITIDLNGFKLNITTTYWSVIGAKNDDARILIQDGTMTSSQTSGTWNSYDLCFTNCNYAFEGVAFEKAIALESAGKSFDLKNVTINETHDYYAMWISAKGQTVNIDGLTIESAGRGIKIDEQYVSAPAKVTLNVINAIFTTAKKAAIVVKSVAGAEINVENIDIANVAEDTEFAVWVDEDSKAYADKVSVTGAYVKVEGAESAVVSTADDLKSALESGKDVVAVAEGEYTFPSSSVKAGQTIICAEGTVFTGTSSLNINGATVIGATFQSGSNGLVANHSTINGTYKDCVFNGDLKYSKAGDTVVFENCVFNGPDYALHFDTAVANSHVILKGCEVNSEWRVAIGAAVSMFEAIDTKFNVAGFINLWGKAKFTNCAFNKPSYWICCMDTTEFTNCTCEGRALVANDILIEETVITIDGVTYEIVADGVMKVNEDYEISSKAGMFWFANEVNANGNAFAGKTVKLTADIDLNNEAWTPVGQTGATTFNGVFDGQNYTISNLNVDSSAQTGAYYSSGLFGWVESHTAGRGHIKNVKINGATIVGHHNCGALVGYITQETALVENCHVTGAAVTCTKANDDADGDKAGALIGNATVATPVKDCTAANSTVSAGRDAGQIIGAGKEANVTGCSATDVTVTANGTGTGANVRNEVIGRLL